MRRLAALVALFMAALALPALAQVPARPDGPIADYANVIDDVDEAMLDARLRAYTDTTGRAVIVATVPTLDGQGIEEYSLATAEEWGIGGKQSENGVLFLIAPNERELRIETARGVQERLTDIMSGRIIRDTVVPEFKAGRMSDGIVLGTEAIITQLDMDPAQAKAIEEARAAREASEGGGGFPIGALLMPMFFLFFFVLPALRRGGRVRTYRSSPWGSAARDIILWEAGKAVVRSMSDRDGGFGGFGGGGGGFGGFGGFGGGGGGFNGGGASGSW